MGCPDLYDLYDLFIEVPRPEFVTVQKRSTIMVTMTGLIAEGNFSLNLLAFLCSEETGIK